MFARSSSGSGRRRPTAHRCVRRCHGPAVRPPPAAHRPWRASRPAGTASPAGRRRSRCEQLPGGQFPVAEERLDDPQAQRVQQQIGRRHRDHSRTGAIIIDVANVGVRWLTIELADETNLRVALTRGEKWAALRRSDLTIPWSQIQTCRSRRRAVPAGARSPCARARRALAHPDRHLASQGPQDLCGHHATHAGHPAGAAGSRLRAGAAVPTGSGRPGGAAPGPARRQPIAGRSEVRGKSGPADSG